MCHIREFYTFRLELSTLENRRCLIRQVPVAGQTRCSFRVLYGEVRLWRGGAHPEQGTTADPHLVAAKCRCTTKSWKVVQNKKDWKSTLKTKKVSRDNETPDSETRWTVWAEWYIECLQYISIFQKQYIEWHNTICMKILLLCTRMRALLQILNRDQQHYSILWCISQKHSCWPHRQITQLGLCSCNASASLNYSLKFKHV